MKPKLNDWPDTSPIDKTGNELSKKFVEDVRAIINPTEKDKTLPFYEMLMKCIVNGQIRENEISKKYRNE